MSSTDEALAPWLQPAMLKLVDAFSASYLRLLKRPLLSESTPLRRAAEAFRSPMILLCHTGEEDPVYQYGNRAALALWEMTWEELTSLPSRQCAEPDHQEQRNAYLEQVRLQGFAEGYSGVRISRTGRRFRIENVCCWEVNDPDGKRIGQAAAYTRWSFL